MILAIDTATRWVGIALHNGDAILAEVGYRCVNNHTRALAPAIDRLMADVQVKMTELSGIAVAVGPGSYTGLRVGLAVAKGIALARQIPVIGVPTLDIVAASFGPDIGRLLVAAEAGRTRVCTCQYDWYQDQGWQPIDSPSIDAWPELLAKLETPMIITGEISSRAAELIHQAGDHIRLVSGARAVRRPGVLAEMGWRRWRLNQVDDPRTLTPLYLRGPSGS